MLKSGRCALLASAAIAAVLFATPSAAQEAAPASQATAQAAEDETQDITVTARRREESLQHVPVAITAFTAQDLATKNVQTVADLQNFVPSLNVTTSTSRNDYQLAIRGMGQTAGLTTGQGGGTGVASYFAEAATSSAGPGLFFDLTNVQVLKGPQGTLFGKNTTGGAVLFTPRRPGNDFGGYIEASVGNFRMRKVTGALNIPIVGDKVLLRIAGEASSRNGFTVDRGPFFPGKDYDNVGYFAGRATLLIRPVEGLENQTIVTGFRNKVNGDGYVLAAINPALASPALTSYSAQQNAAGIRSTSFSTNEIDKRFNYGIFNTTTWNVSDTVILKNIFSYQVQKLLNANDIDASPFVVNDLVGTSSKWHLQTGTYTEELQAQGTALNSNLQWTAGGYYEFGHNIAPVPFRLIVGGGFEIVQPDNPYSTRTRGLYAQLTYNLGGLIPGLDGLKFTGGYRHTWDSYKFAIAVYSPTIGNACLSSSGTFPASNCLFGLDGRSDAGSWTLGLDYQVTPNTLVYVRSGKGYLPGGVNPSVALVPGGSASPDVAFAPATNIDVEVGVKSRFTVGNVPVTINADAFRTDFSNIQRLVSKTIFGISTSFTTNASAAVIEGIELEARVAPAKGFALNATYSYNHGRYTEIDPAVAPTLLGLPFANLPAHQLSLGTSFDRPLPGNAGHVFLSATYSYQSKFFNAPTIQPLANIESRGLLNASATWANFLSSGMDATVFVTNATNKSYRIGQNNNYFTDGFITSFYGEPRMYGLKLQYRFGGER
jgi:iron complex outermembrane receptor protein